MYNAHSISHLLTHMHVLRLECCQTKAVSAINSLVESVRGSVMSTQNTEAERKAGRERSSTKASLTITTAASTAVTQPSYSCLPKIDSVSEWFVCMEADKSVSRVKPSIDVVMLIEINEQN